MYQGFQLANKRLIVLRGDWMRLGEDSLSRGIFFVRGFTIRGTTEYVCHYHSQCIYFLNFVHYDVYDLVYSLVIQVVNSEYFTGVRNLNISKDVAMITESQNALCL